MGNSTKKTEVEEIYRIVARFGDGKWEQSDKTYSFLEARRIVGQVMAAGGEATARIVPPEKKVKRSKYDGPTLFDISEFSKGKGSNGTY